MSEVRENQAEFRTGVKPFSIISYREEASFQEMNSLGTEFSLMAIF